jgi:hypothetical protein
MKILLVEVELFDANKQTDRQTDITKLIVFYTNVPKKCFNQTYFF